MPLKSFYKCFRVATTKKTPFSPENPQKMPICTPNQCFLGPGGQFVPPPPLFGGCWTHEKDAQHDIEPNLKVFQGRQD